MPIMVSIMYLSMIILSAVMLYFIGVYNNYVVWQLIKYHLHYTWLCFLNLILLRGEVWRLTSMLLSLQCVLLHFDYITHEFDYTSITSRTNQIVRGTIER